jgi:signal transduction histidine kinase
MKTLLVIFSFISFSLFAQPNFRADSLSSAYNQASYDTSKVQILNQLALAEIGKNPLKTLQYTEQSYELATQISYQKGIADALQIKGVLNYRIGDVESAFANLLPALEIYQQLNDKHSFALTLRYIGNAYFTNEDYVKSIDYYTQSYYKSIELNNEELLATCAGNIGRAYSYLQQYDSAIFFLSQSEIINRKLNNQYGLANVFMSLGKVLTEQDKHKEGLLKLFEALELLKISGDFIRCSEVICIISQSYLSKGQTIRAKMYARQAVEFASKSQAKQYEVEAYKLLFQINKLEQNYDSATYYLELHNIVRDCLYNEQKAKQIADITINYDFKRNIYEKELLKQKSELQYSVINQQKIIIVAIFIVVLLTTGLSYSYFRTNKKTKKLNHEIIKINAEINEQKEKLSIQNEQITFQNKQLEQKNEKISSQRDDIEKQNNKLKSQQLILEDTVSQMEELNQQLSEANEKIKSRQVQLVQSEKMFSLGQLTAGIAHEINNPVNFIGASIIGLRDLLNDLQQIIMAYETLTIDNANSQLILIDNLKKELGFQDIMIGLVELAGNIEAGAKRTAEIVRGLRTFSRLDENALKDTNIHENLDATLVILRNQYKDRIDVIKKYDENLPIIKCFPGKLNQVFINLISNAIHAIKKKKTGKIGFITIQTTFLNEQKQLCIAISDDGTGIKPEHFSKIFDPFFTTKEIGEGTGLGLSISLGIIKDHQGKIEIQTEWGVGTTFYIYIPTDMIIQNNID